MRNEKEEVQYIWHDGVRIREDQLISMAKSAGSYALAEHYLLSVLAHGTMHGLAYLINKVNEVREFYQVRTIPTPKQMDEDSVVPTSKFRISIEEQTRKLYSRMSHTDRLELLYRCLELLMANHPKLFRFRNQWQAIYFVMRDRLDCGLTQKRFVSMASAAMPLNWPERIEITGNEFKNLRRDSQIDDYNEAYYEMSNNPHRVLCDTFWEIVKQEICGINVEQ